MERFDQHREDDDPDFTPPALPEDFSEAIEAEPDITAPPTDAETDESDTSQEPEAAQPSYLAFREVFDGTQEPHSPEEIAQAGRDFTSFVSEFLSAMPKDHLYSVGQRGASFEAEADGGEQLFIQIDESDGTDPGRPTSVSIMKKSIIPISIVPTGDATEYYLDDEGAVIRCDKTFPDDLDQEALQLVTPPEELYDTLSNLAADEWFTQGDVYELERTTGLNYQPVGPEEIAAMRRAIEEWYTANQ